MENEIKTLGETLYDLPRDAEACVLSESKRSPTSYVVVAMGKSWDLFMMLGECMLDLRAELCADGYIIVSDERIRPITQ